MSKIIVDVSKHQGVIDWVLLASKVDGVIIRAGIGYSKDYRFEENYREARLRGLPVGAYHYWLDYLSPETQAAKFAEFIAGKVFTLAAAFPGLANLWGDLEAYYSGNPKPVMQSNGLNYLTGIEKRRTADPVGVYTRGTYWNTYIGFRAAFARFPLWVARYPYLPPIPHNLPAGAHPWNDDPGRFRPLPWQSYALWQWSADDNARGPEFGVQSDDIDINVLAVEPVQPPPPPDPEPEPFPKKARVINTGILNVRNLPNVLGIDVGNVYRDDILDVYAQIDNSGDTWLLIRDRFNLAGWSVMVYRGQTFLEWVA